jgi:hypothetical protein
VGVKRYDAVATLLPSHANVADNHAQPPALNKNPETLFNNPLKLSQEQTVIRNVSKLTWVLRILLNIPIGWGS